MVQACVARPEALRRGCRQRHYARRSECLTACHTKKTVYFSCQGSSTPASSRLWRILGSMLKPLWETHDGSKMWKEKMLSEPRTRPYQSRLGWKSRACLRVESWQRMHDLLETSTKPPW